jgi:hypothetical protein
MIAQYVLPRFPIFRATETLVDLSLLESLGGAMPGPEQSARVKRTKTARFGCQRRTMMPPLAASLLRLPFSSGLALSLMSCWILQGNRQTPGFLVKALGPGHSWMVWTHGSDPAFTLIHNSRSQRFWPR